MLFAPVYFESDVYSRRGYSYSPTIVIGLDVFADHLFVRPRYQHYYFGDYYAPAYSQGGFYASFSFQSSRYGYDPFYSHQRWEHREDREWEHRAAASYEYRRDNEAARPPRTWADQRRLDPAAPESERNRLQVAASIDQAKRTDRPMRFQPVARDERQALAQRGQDVQKFRDQRRTLETTTGGTATRKSDGAFEPAKVQLPRLPDLRSWRNRPVSWEEVRLHPKHRRRPNQTSWFSPNLKPPAINPTRTRAIIDPCRAR